MNESLLTDERDRVVESLTSGYAHGAFDVEELERRVALVYAAKSTTELQAILTDVAPIPASETMALVPAKKMRIIMGSIEKTGPWAVPQQLRARVVMGSLQLDLREARLAAGGVTTIEVDVTMGNVEVIVPPGFQVDVDASSLLGHVEERTDRVTGTPATVIRVVGRVRLGNLEVSTLQRGETRGDARRRWRDERRERRWRRRHWRRMRHFDRC
jgi:hypothetical protein